jgi:hypothetical protein
VLVAATATGPWWGPPALTLVGVFLGGVLSQIYGLWNNKRTTRDSLRALEREVCTRFLIETDDFMNPLYEHRAPRSSVDLVLRIYAEIELIGSDDVSEAAQDVYMACQRVGANIEENNFEDVDQALLHKLFNARRRFVQLARKSQGLPADAV